MNLMPCCLVLSALLLGGCGTSERSRSDAAKQVQAIERTVTPAAIPSSGLKEIRSLERAETTAPPTTAGKLTIIAPSTELSSASQQRQHRPAAAMARLVCSYEPPVAMLAIAKPEGGTYMPDNTKEPLIEVQSRPLGEGPTLSGLDVLEREQFQRLQGKRVALLTNNAAISKQGRHILDLMAKSPNVQLVKLFSPEHGLYGNVDTKTPDMVDTRTQLQVHSLYSKRSDAEGKPFHPRLKDLKGLDLVVIDLQDIGTRFYTYCSYMAFMMESCAEAGIEVMVLDRPNPIGGLYVDGPLLDDDLLAGVTTYFKMPVAHGMTMGEMARMFNAENRIGCKLTVVEMENWRRSMFLDQTGMRWVNPSPNIRDLDAALVYPGIGVTEALVSMGRGTEEPFHLFGAPFIENPEEMVRQVMSPPLEGVKLEPTSFSPSGTLSRGHIGEGKVCKGARITITDRSKFRPVELGLRVAHYLQGKYGSQMVEGASGRTRPVYDVMALRASLNALVCARIREQKPLEQTMKCLQIDIQRFLPVRAKYLIYPE